MDYEDEADSQQAAQLYSYSLSYLLRLLSDDRGRGCELRPFPSFTGEKDSAESWTHKISSYIHTCTHVRL